LILDLAGDVNGRTLLDLGCGGETLAVAFWERGAKVAGIPRR
jgi:ribosomal protein L11 methylase PrmA